MTDDKDATIAALRARVKVLEDACGWVATHDAMSEANARRQQVVVAGALFRGLTPVEALRQVEPKDAVAK